MKVSTGFERTKHGCESTEDADLSVSFEDRLLEIHCDKNYHTFFEQDNKQFVISIYEFAYNLGTKCNGFGGFNIGN